MNYKKVYKSGSFTVEISLLMPFILMVVLLLLFWMIYMYDLSVMQSALTRGTKQVFYYVGESNALIEKECAQVIYSDLKDCLLCVEDLEVSIQVSAMSVEGKVTGVFSVPEILSVKDHSGNSIWRLHTEWKEPKLHTAQLILTGQQAKEIYEKITEDIKEGEGDVREENGE